MFRFLICQCLVLMPSLSWSRSFNQHIWSLCIVYPSASLATCLSLPGFLSLSLSMSLSLSLLFGSLFLTICLALWWDLTCSLSRQWLLTLESRDPICIESSAGPKRGCINVGAWNPQESGRKAPLSCNAAFWMLQCSFSFAAAPLLVQMTSALQKANVAVQFLHRSIPKTAAQLPFSLVACCRGGV